MSTRPRTMLLLSAPLALLSACQTPIVVQTTALDCPALIHPDLRRPTPSAPGPEDDSKNAWRGFGIRQTGQVDKANVDKEVILHIVDECHKQSGKATEDARRRNTPWYKRVL